METTIKRWFSLICSALILVIGLTACSDENPDTEDWRSRLITHNGSFAYPNVEHHHLAGDSYECVGLGIRIIDKNTGRDLLENVDGNVLESDFYFEIDKFQYHMGDTANLLMTYPEASKVVGVYYFGGGYGPDTFPYLTCHYMLPYYIGGITKKVPLDFTVDFVWPSKGIRKHIRTYFEFNKNFSEDGLLLEPDEYGFSHPVLYREGYWIDGIYSLDYGVQEDGTYVRSDSESYEYSILTIPV